MWNDAYNCIVSTKVGIDILIHVSPAHPLPPTHPPPPPHTHRWSCTIIFTKYSYFATRLHAHGNTTQVHLLSNDFLPRGQVGLDGAEYWFKVHPILEDVDHLSHGPERGRALLLSLQTVQQVANSIAQIAIQGNRGWSGEMDYHKDTITCGYSL